MTERSPEHDLVACHIVDAAFAVHCVPGPGLVESVYEQCLAYESEVRDIPFQRQVALPVYYRDKRIDAGFRMDVVVGGLVVVEIKAIEKTVPVHEAQPVTYLKLSGHKFGLLINFNVVLIKYAIKRWPCCAAPVRSGCPACRDRAPPTTGALVGMGLAPHSHCATEDCVRSEAGQTPARLCDRT
jgi:GxxExxY protein